MSKRKREIQKKKKLAEDAVKDEDLLTTEAATDVGTEGGPDHEVTTADKLHPAPSPVDDSQIVNAREPAVLRKRPSQKKKVPDPVPAKAAISNTWFDQNKENFLLGLLVFYVFLLGLGTVGELLEIEWILNLPLFK